MFRSTVADAGPFFRSGSVLPCAEKQKYMQLLCGPGKGDDDGDGEGGGTR